MSKSVPWVSPAAVRDLERAMAAMRAKVLAAQAFLDSPQAELLSAQDRRALAASNLAYFEAERQVLARLDGDVA